MPKAYVICDIDVIDPEAYEEYRRLSSLAAAAHDVRFIVRGGATEVLEGDRVPNRTVVLEFASADAARAWFHSPEYTAAREARKDAARGSFILVEGTD